MTRVRWTAKQVRLCKERLNPASAGNAIVSFGHLFANVRKLTTTTAVSTKRMQEAWPKRNWPTFEETLGGAAEYYRSLAAISA